MILFVATLLYLFVPRPPATHFGAFVAGGKHYYENKEWQAEAQDESNDVEGNEESEELDDSQENRLENDEAGNSQGDTVSEKELALSEGTSPFSGNVFNRDIFAYEGFQKSCDIQKPKQSRQSNDIVLYLQAEQPLYLRGEVFDTFNNHNWTKHFSGDKKLVLEYDEISFGDEMNNDGVSQIITLNKNMSSGTLFAAETVKMLRFPASVIARNHYGTLQAPSPLRKGTVYSVKSYFEMIKDHPASGAESLDDPAPYLQLPQTLSSRIPALAQTITQHATTDLVRALAIEAHLRHHYTYTFKTVLASPGKMLLEEFLFETRHGHCELFATAMVILLRTQHIPARLATGFSATNLNPLTGYYEIRALDAHAWVEGYFPEYGWVLFEPTAYYNLPTPKQSTTTAEALVEYLENMAEAAEVIAPNADSTTWLNALLGAIHQIKAWLFMTWKWISNVFTELWYFFARFGIYLILAALLLGVIFVYGRHTILTRLSLWRLQRARNGNPRYFVLRCYQELERLFTRYGYPRHAGWTANEYAEILTKDHANLSQPINAITESFIQVRYSCYIPSQTEIQHRYADFQEIRQFAVFINITKKTVSINE
jgi:transglutaminase-like putative cysteine protease